MQLDQATPEQLRQWEADLAAQYEQFKAAGLNLDLTRGKPSADQLALSDALDGILEGNYKAEDGTDLRNYGGLDGLPEAKRLFASMLDVKPEQVLIGGNASLNLMYTAAHFAMHYGPAGTGSAWANEGTIKFLCPVPGYDRHFGVCEQLGIEMIPVAMDQHGPDMDEVERLVQADPSIKGIWCVPRFSNPSGIVYSDAVVRRIAGLGKIAGANFRVFWDNAYAIHFLNEDAQPLAPVMTLAEAEGCADSIYIFGSTSKITHAGAGVAFMAASANNLKHFKQALGMTTIGPDKINQARHVKFLKDEAGLTAHMRKHADLLKPRFDAVLRQLDKLEGTGMGSWTAPEGGYFIAFDTRPGLAKEVVRLAGEAGVKLTPAGATFPYGNDPEDRNIRLAPSFPSVADIERATEVFVTCVQLASVRQALAA